MNLRDFRNLLRVHAFRKLTFVHPDGEPIPAEFHITEVGHVFKRFMDCGGKLRTVENLLLQTWVCDTDKDHRLSAGKAADILDLSQKVIPSDALEVEIEYEGCAVSQYTLSEAKVEGDELRFQMAHKHTDCLAREICGAGGAAVEGGCCS